MSENPAKCNDKNCRFPSFVYSSGEIVVHNRHSGNQHINKINAFWVIEQLIIEGRESEILKKIKDFKNGIK